ncbi:winged helix DNA-binding domain-containing protein [Tsukamurella pseudospumae]|uniref:Winged helix DNA-binding domain-containing protein n=1 Tax=Tsukamurella pseudospumae TaxID=239498 RepID=A0A138AJ01_9ACTN|nr:winged helix DNA-binding domain-containing protein [Tsukamurella pseudospumae]KXP10372.1 hypothetical protein AXK60_07920 [Tsukamurella pseudospumae]
MAALPNDRIIGYRLRAHGLVERADPDALPTAAGRCGIQDSPPGSALLALHARVTGVAPGTLDARLDDRALLRTWCMRGAPFVIPVDGAAVFTAGVLPGTEAAVRHFLLGLGPALDDLGMSADGAVAAVAVRTTTVLSGRRLAIGPLGAEVAEAMTAELSPAQRSVWTADGPWSAGQSLGEGVVHFCLRILTLRGLVCFAPREDDTAPFVLVEEWLGHPLPGPDGDDARAELVRRYLRCYGPSTKADFAAWLGVRAGDAGLWWNLVESDLERVETQAGRAWVHADDLESLRTAADPAGTRLLPPRDPYTRARDRSVIVAPEHHRAVWRTVGEPGTVLIDGRIAGTWRPRKHGKRLTLTITPFAPLSARARRAVTHEAEQVGTLRGAASTEVAIDS